MGDPSGIGPEITLKAWQALRDHPEYAFAVIADESVFRAHPKDINPPLNPLKGFNAAKIIDRFKVALPIVPLQKSALADFTSPIYGKPNPKNAFGILQSIELGVEHVLSGQACALVTNPISKDVLYRAGFIHPGHTEFLGVLTEHGPAPYKDPSIRGPVMMLSAGGLRVALATVHVPLKTAAATLSQDKIIKTARVMHAALQRDFGISNPRIALAGLNPHAGENGALGLEEAEIINPAAEILRNQGLNVTNAQPADTLFHAEAREGYDAVLAMYHDQGLIPVKTLDFHGGVNITLGLPIIRTSPDHGTAFDIAGQNLARPDSLIAAIKAARDLADCRSRNA